MTNILAEICATTSTHITAQKSHTPLSEVKARAKDVPPPKGFITALESHTTPAIICEIKKASPSKGIIREDFDPLVIAKTYQDNGGACLSVLTDTPYFQGSDAIFQTVRAACDLPMLRKDFMLDPYQIHESRALGADCILLIMAALSDDDAKDLYETATALGMDTLFEIHNQEELDRTLPLNPRMVGVNNRNLKTLNVDIQTSVTLARNIPSNIHKVAESGLGSHTTLQKLQGIGYNSFLIGESMMREDDIATALKTLQGQNGT